MTSVLFLIIFFCIKAKIAWTVVTLYASAIGGQNMGAGTGGKLSSSVQTFALVCCGLLGGIESHRHLFYFFEVDGKWMTGMKSMGGHCSPWDSPNHCVSLEQRGASFTRWFEPFLYGAEMGVGVLGGGRGRKGSWLFYRAGKVI